MNEDCEEMHEKMVEGLLDLLSQQDRDALNEHVAQCSNCAARLRAFRDEKALLGEFAETVRAGMQQRKDRTTEAIRRCDLTERRAARSRRATVMRGSFARIALAAGLLVAAGFLAGRLVPARQVDVEQLRAALEKSLKSSLEEGIYNKLAEQVNRDRESALERHYVRLKDELADQSHREMTRLAEMTLAASEASTEQRLAELIGLIEAARTVDHWQIARAFEQVESSRIEDRIRLGESIVALGSLKDAGAAAEREQN